MLCYTVNGSVTISPPGVAPVCCGHQLQLICTITRMENHSRAKLFHIRSSEIHSNRKYMSFHYGDSTIRFIRISHSMLLTSYRMLISPVSSSLNGTEVMCKDLMNQQSSSTVINVENGQGIRWNTYIAVSQYYNNVCNVYSNRVNLNFHSLSSYISLHGIISWDSSQYNFRS